MKNLTKTNLSLLKLKRQMINNITPKFKKILMINAHKKNMSLKEYIKFLNYVMNK
jgi:hypothetical protein